MVYQWKIDKYPVPAQVAGEEIERIRANSGKGYIEAEDLLESSREDNAPLHSCFEWDVDKAAEKYRLWQARDIIKHIAVVIQNTPAAPQPVRAFVSIADYNDKGKFIQIQKALENNDYRAQVLKNALAELQTFKHKYSVYSELSKVFEAIDGFADSLK